MEPDKYKWIVLTNPVYDECLGDLLPLDETVCYGPFDSFDEADE